MHTILGAGGPVANALTRELKDHNQTIRLVSRRPSTITGDKISWRKADLLNYEEVLEASRGSEVIYLCAGLVYDARVWREEWPKVMANVIQVTKETGARLIFFDNVYMYGLVNGPMTEHTPYRPVSEKGRIRAGVAEMIMNEVKAGHINATIARAPDFYGTDSGNSAFDMMVLSRYAKKENAQWLGDADKLHTFIHIADAASAMYLLGQHPDSGNQIWHLPVAKPLTGKQFITLAAATYQVKPKFMAIGKLMLRLIGLFDKVIAGSVEMYYQYNHDYIFDSSKFEKAFKFKPTSYQEGIKEVAGTLYKPQ